MGGWPPTKKEGEIIQVEITTMLSMRGRSVRVSIYNTTKCPGIVMMIINSPESPKQYHEPEHEPERTCNMRAACVNVRP